MIYASLGADISYTRTGISLCLFDSSFSDELSFELHNFRTNSKENLIKRTNYIKHFIGDFAKSLDLDSAIKTFSIEATAFGGRASALMNGLNMSVLTYIYEEFPMWKMLVISPSTLKRYIGVKSNKKSEIRRKFQEINPMARKFCHDEIDAYYLSKLGMVSLFLAEERHSEDEKAIEILTTEKTNKKGKPLGLMRRVDEFYFHERGVYI